MMKMYQVVIRQFEGYTQLKREEGEYYEQLCDFLHQILKVYAPKRRFWRNCNYPSNMVKVLLILGHYAVFIEFCKIYR